MNNFNSVSDKLYLKKITHYKNKNIPSDTYRSGKTKREQEIDLAYEAVEGECIVELCEAESQEDVYDLLYVALGHIIDQYDLDLEAEDVLPHFWDVYRLKDSV